MNNHRLAWAVTCSGHYIEECLDFLPAPDNVNLFLSQAVEEGIKMYGFNLLNLREKMPGYRNKNASSLPVGQFYKVSDVLW